MLRILGRLARSLIRRGHERGIFRFGIDPSEIPPSPELQDAAVKSVENVEKRSNEIENKLSKVEGSIDPLRAMVEQMRNEDFWR